MPKSKRDQIVTLTKTSRKGRGRKAELIESIRDCCDQYAWVFVFSLAHSRNATLREVREAWQSSRIFLGKLAVSQVALGRDPESAYQQDLHLLGRRLTGNRGLLFTNTPRDDVIKWCADFCKPEYARGGNVASETVVLPTGELPFPFSMEAHVRQLGVPVVVKNGVLTLDASHTVCTKGRILTPDQAAILKLMGRQLAEFRMVIEAGWSDGKFESFVDVANPDGGEGKKAAGAMEE